VQLTDEALTALDLTCFAEASIPPDVASRAILVYAQIGAARPRTEIAIHNPDGTLWKRILVLDNPDSQRF